MPLNEQSDLTFVVLFVPRTEKVSTGAQGTQAETHPQRSQLQVGLHLESVGGVSVVGQPYADILAKLKDGAYSDVQISCLHTLRDCI